MAGALPGKVALVTGGNSGIGEATVHRLAQEGAQVVIVARRQAEGDAVEQAVRAAGGEATFISCDVMERPAVEKAVAQAVALYGCLHILFNNAGGGTPHQFRDAADAAWETTLRRNLLSTFMMTQVAWPHLVNAGGGSIINMSSTTAVMAVSTEQRTLLPRIPGPAYGAAKAAVEAYTRYTAAEGAPHGDDPLQRRASGPDCDAAHHTRHAGTPLCGAVLRSGATHARTRCGAGRGECGLLLGLRPVAVHQRQSS
jgi:NAD(P)-dependent dehydrogenase (short-subunit alcohol dehydrogenase family)